MTEQTRQTGGVSPKSQPDRSAIAFTLIELLTVIVIIGILASMLVPTVSAILASAYAARTQARINSIGSACGEYQTDYGFYPGQRWTSDLLAATKYGNGSAVLAHAMFSPKDDPNAFPDSAYLSYTSSYLLDPNDTQSGIADNFPPDMAICYYISRLTSSGLSQYQYSDNSSFTGGHTDPNNTQSAADQFSAMIVDDRFGSTDTPYNTGKYLLLAPGKDRLYFTSDDIKNW